jgi:hypothetical protein
MRDLPLLTATLDLLMALRAEQLTASATASATERQTLQNIQQRAAALTALLRATLWLLTNVTSCVKLQCSVPEVGGCVAVKGLCACVHLRLCGSMLTLSWCFDVHSFDVTCSHVFRAFEPEQ